jgi:hypothetical protein
VEAKTEGLGETASRISLRNIHGYGMVRATNDDVTGRPDTVRCFSAAGMEAWSARCATINRVG